MRWSGPWGSGPASSPAELRRARSPRPGPVDQWLRALPEVFVAGDTGWTSTVERDLTSSASRRRGAVDATTMRRDVDHVGLPAAGRVVDCGGMDDIDTLARQYRRFAEHEAHGSSPSLEDWALAVATDHGLLARLATLPGSKRQPNLVFAALRWHGAQPGDEESLRQSFRESWAEVSRTIQQRSTQTNEPARCAVFLPLLHQIPGPIALIELGAAAGLCLIPDHYSYRYSDGTVVDPPLGPSDLVIECRLAAGTLPLDLATPQIVWRAGLDLNPLDPADPDTAAWLATLIWPEHEHRRRRLASALRLAAASTLRIDRGDLRHRLTALLAEAPAGATPVVLHSATLAYLPALDRAAITDAIAASNARWISFEGRGVITPTGQLPEPLTPETLFLAALDRSPIALSNGHGDTITLLEG